MALASGLAPGHGSLQFGAYAEPRNYGVYGQYMARIQGGPALFARGDYMRGYWQARAGLQWDW